MNCPRCESENVRAMAKSPVVGVWEVYSCGRCCYSWRSTEDVKISEVFKLTEQKIAEMDVIPPIPPLKK